MSHYYLQDGTPYYTLVGKNGKERDVTVKDARKVGAGPGVTTVTGQLNKPGLNYWNIQKTAEAAFLVLKSADISNFETNVLSKHKEITSIYSANGDLVHKEFENYYLNKGIKDEFKPYIKPALDLLHKKYSLGDYVAEPEISFYNPAGFGGKIDLVLTHVDTGDKVIIDFKSKAKSVLSKEMISDDYVMQLAAYKNSFTNVVECYNLVVSTETPGVCELFKHDKKDLELAYKRFLHLLRYWQSTNNYPVYGE